MEEMTIGKVAKRAGVRPSALRYYESVGVLPAPRRVNGRRRYEGEVLDLLAIVRVAQQAGFYLRRDSDAVARVLGGHPAFGALAGACPPEAP